MTECTVTDCYREARKRGLCWTHYARWRRHGDTSVARPMADRNPDSYAAVHWRVKARRGRASAQQCSVDGCDRQATSWAWLRTGPSEEDIDPAGRRRTWGTDISDYAPMCGTHSHQLDHGGTLERCPRGHDRATYGAANNGECRGCNRERGRARTNRKAAS